MSTPTEERTTNPASHRQRQSPRQLILTGGLLGLAGVIGLIVAAEYAPTLTNVLTHDWVLKPGAYIALRLISFAAVGAGFLLALAGVIRHRRKSDHPPQHSAGPTMPH